MVSMAISSSMAIFGFNKESDISDWQIVNDAVMGGPGVFGHQ